MLNGLKTKFRVFHEWVIETIQCKECGHISKSVHPKDKSILECNNCCQMTQFTPLEDIKRFEN